jgi:hypothetical protein
LAKKRAGYPVEVLQRRPVFLSACGVERRELAVSLIEPSLSLNAMSVTTMSIELWEKWLVSKAGG